MAIQTNKRDNSKLVGIESGIPEIGTRVGVNTIGMGKYAVQSGMARIGALIGINGGLAPNTALPGESCNYEFWTCKQGYIHETYNGQDVVKDSALYLLQLNLAGDVKNYIDLDPVLISIIKNIQVRADVYERVPVAPHWVNPYYYDRHATWEPGVTPASPDYFDIPRSYTTKVVQYISGDRNVATNYIRPASYAGPLGPVYAGVTAVTDPVSSPWNLLKAPADPSNIQVRDIKLDANDNLWIILQIGWEYCRTYLSQQSPIYYDQELSTWLGYEDTGGTPNAANLYDAVKFTRLYNPSGNKYRAGPIRPRVFIVCFDKATEYKTWDYVPFRPGTRGFNKLSRESNARGPAIYGITVPPSKLDADPYGNIYYSVGTADIWEGTTYNSSLHCYGIAKNEIGYLYVKPFTERSQTVTEGLDVGRMGPYPSQCTIIAYDQNTMAYYNHEIGRQDKPAFRAPWTWVIGGDRVAITRWKYQAGIETWYASTFGNATAFRATFLINPSATFPHPYVTTPQNWGPCEIRATNNEWLTTNPALKCANRDTDLLFAACDYLHRNYSYLSNPATYECASWWRHETSWSPGLNTFPQVHPGKDMWFEVGSGDTEPYTGWKPSESPGFWYTHCFVKTGIWMEEGVRSYAITDTRSWVDKGFLPLFGAVSDIQDCFFRVASTPYAQPGIVAGTDYYEHHALSGMLPTCKVRQFNEDTLIIPKYDFKHEIISFSGQTWDTYDSVRKKFGIYVNSVPWPWRWHSMKGCIEQASHDELDVSKYGVRSAYLDPASYALPGDYQPTPEDKIFYYDESWDALWADVSGKMNRPEVNQALQGMYTYITQAKWHYWETGLTNLNYGAFSCAVNCNDIAGFLFPRYKLSVTFYDDPATGDYYINVITDTRPLKRLYLVTGNKTGDLAWSKQGTPGTKTWWARITDWINPADPIQVTPPVASSKYYDLPISQIAGLKSWNPDTTVERYQQICFKNWYPKGLRESPQFY